MSTRRALFPPLGIVESGNMRIHRQVHKAHTLLLVRHKGTGNSARTCQSFLFLFFLNDVKKITAAAVDTRNPFPVHRSVWLKARVDFGHALNALAPCASGCALRLLNKHLINTVKALTLLCN